MKIISYDITQYPLVNLVGKILGVMELSLLHETLSTLPELVVHKTDQSTLVHKKYYAQQELIMNCYGTIISDIVRPLFNETILYQAKPTFRCQLPNNLSVGAFHKDADYSHSEQEINFFIPLTKCFDTNTIWVESAPDKGDYSPVNLDVGQILIFDGANLTHGNKINKTGLTRISLDFRVLPLSSYDPNNSKVTTNIKKRMVVGDYFNVCS